VVDRFLLIAKPLLIGGLAMVLLSACRDRAGYLDVWLDEDGFITIGSNRCDGPVADGVRIYLVDKSGSVPAEPFWQTSEDFVVKPARNSDSRIGHRPERACARRGTIG
jgi:hypothetical protein